MCICEEANLREPAQTCGSSQVRKSPSDSETLTLLISSSSSPLTEESESSHLPIAQVSQFPVRFSSVADLNCFSRY